jgi:PAS domain S-box-containing protein
MAQRARDHATEVTVGALAVRPNILIVDDRKENLLATEKILRHLDAGIFQANSGNEALSLVLRHRFAIVLLDVQMPEMDGFETAMLMQEHESMRGVPIIFVTAISKEERYATRAAEIGAVDYIFKPINSEILKRKVQVYLDLYAQREELLKLNMSLQQSNEELERFAYNRGLLEAAPDAMVVVSQSGEIVLVNRQAENQFGYRRDELVGQKMTNIIPVGFAERLIADGTRSAAEALAQQIGTGIELSGRRKDGSEFPIEIMLSPLESAKGMLVTAAIRDISERKRAEETLRTSEERLRLIVSHAKDYAILMLDPEGLVVSWNEGAERIKGYKAEQIIGQHFSRLYPAEDISNGKPDFELAEATRVGRYEDEGWRIRQDGSRFLANDVTTALRDEIGDLRGFGRITRDVTERKKAEEHLAETVADLERSNEELQQFANVASHDLQEPLRMVASYTQLLAKRYKGRLDPDADEFIMYAVDGCTRMQRLIEDLLTYSRAGITERSKNQISGENALNVALTNLQLTIEESGAVVTHDPLPAVAMHDAQLSQVFQNLVGNAIKYRGAEVPRIHVSAERSSGDEWTFSVQDNGLGIDRQYFHKIFILFQRLHGRNEFKGTGIGLSICKKIVERSGGKIWVESQPEQGSTFYFSLPEGQVKQCNPAK